ncbi:MAG TPA: hypothetical protein VLL08_33350 [Kineosporiaceae bacterium]|nr:hypothetical protein [Kineosporiaceae bacterium]
MIATCTRCNNSFDGNDGPDHTNHVTAFGHPPEQHYQVIADLSAVGNPPVTLEIPDPVAALIRSGALTLAIVPDPDQPRGLGLREIILNPPLDTAREFGVQAIAGCPEPVWDGPYAMPCGHSLVAGRCSIHGEATLTATPEGSTP